MKAWQIGALVGIGAGLLQFAMATDAHPLPYWLGVVLGAMAGGIAIGSLVGFFSRRAKRNG